MRVVIVSDIRLYREGLGELSRRQGVDVVGLAASADEAWDLVKELDPEILLIDSATPSGRALTAQVFDSAVDCHVVAIGLTEAESDVVAWASVGVSAFVTKNSPLEELVTTLEQVAASRWRASPHTVRLLLRHMARTARRSGPADHAGLLTSREHQVAQLIARGLSNKQIARELDISVATVKNHVHAVLQKLNCARRGQAAARLRRLDAPSPVARPPAPRRADAKRPR